MNIADHDLLFSGLNLDLDPAVLPPGTYSRGENVEVENGTVASRPGHLCVPWADTWAYTRTYKGRPMQAHGVVIDAIRFSDPIDGTESLVFVTAEGGFVAGPGRQCIKLAYPAGYSTPSSGRLVQAFSEVFFLCNNSVLRWRGGTSSGWEYLYFDPGALGGGFVGFPKTERGAYFNNRLYLKQDENTIIVSDILAPERFSILNEFFVNQGDADSIVALVPYFQYRLLVFKSNSVYSLDNLTGDLSNAAINLVGSGVGAVSDRSIQVIGQEVFWLARTGVYRAALAYEQRITPAAIPVSKPIERVINRINWGNAKKAVSCISGDRYYLAVPIDDSTVNNCVMVYNLRNGAWESIDELPLFTKNNRWVSGSYTDGFGPQTLINLNVLGREKVVGFTKLGCLYLHRANRGKPDISIEPASSLTALLALGGTVPTSTYNELAINKVDFTTVIETRGYLAQSLATKTGGHIDMTVSTLDPDIDVSIVTTGPNEVLPVKSGITRSRTKRLNYSASGTTTLPTTHTEALLEDYSISLYSTVNGQTTASFNQFYFGDETYEPVDVGREQEFQERYRIIKRFRAPRIRLESSKGIMRLKAVVFKQIERIKPHRREA